MIVNAQKKIRKDPTSRMYRETIMITYDQMKAVRKRMEDEQRTKSQVHRMALKAYLFKKTREQGNPQDMRG